VKSRGEEIDKKKESLVTNREDGWSKSVIAGSTGSGKSWSTMKNSTSLTCHCDTWQQLYLRIGS
jgi:hypothetical protein